MPNVARDNVDDTAPPEEGREGGPRCEGYSRHYLVFPADRNLDALDVFVQIRA